MYGANWNEIGEATSTKTSTKGEVAATDKGPKTVLKLYALSGASTVLFALPEDKLSTDMINPIVFKIFGWNYAIEKVVVLADTYKTKYMNPEELANVPDGVLPMKTHKTSWVSAEDTQWLTSAIGEPSFFMAAATGFGAGCLTHCEMYGLSCIYVTLITDSHSVTTESMQAYTPVLTHLSLPADTDEIFMKPSFRPILKEANTRGNAIFS